jgi:hypothetical protein
MTSDSRPHASSTIEPTRSARLTRYGAAAAFAGLGSGGAAVASVVTSSSVGWSGWTGVVSSINGTLNYTAFGTALLNGGFRFSVRQWTGVRLAYARALGGGNRIGRSRLGGGSVIGPNPPGGNWSSNNGTAIAFSTRSLNGPWSPLGQKAWSLAAAPGPDSVRGFLPFRIGAASGFYYGYFDVEVSRNGNTVPSMFSMTIHGWAYENTLNGSITTPSSVPGSGLAALAVGAAGLRGRRRR